MQVQTFVALLLPLTGALLRAESPGVPPVRRADQVVAFHEARSAARPDDEDAWSKLAGAYVQRAELTGDGADYDRGWKTLDKADALSPGDVRVLQARADLLLSRHHFQAAREMAEKGLKQHPKNPDLLAVAGDGALETGNLDAAADYYSRLKAVSSRVTTWARLAHLNEMRGNLDEAASMLERALDPGYSGVSSADARSWCRAVLGEVEQQRGHPERSRPLYEKGLQETPNHLLVLEHFAELEQSEGHLAASEALYRRILAIHEDPKAELRLAALLETRGERVEAAKLRAEARRFYERAVASGNDGYLRPLAVMELAAGRYERAESLQARDVALRPTHESRGVLQTIQDAAAAAGRPLPKSK